MVDGPVSAETVALDAEGMIAEGRELAKIADNITIKVPLTWDGLKACKTLSDEGRMVNVTLCFSANQALLAAKAGATFISPFIGRLDDINLDGMELIQDIRTIYDNYGFETQILAASIRTVNHMTEARPDRRRRLHRAAGRDPQDGRPPADRQGARGLPRRLEEDRPEDHLKGVRNPVGVDVACPKKSREAGTWTPTPPRSARRCARASSPVPT